MRGKIFLTILTFVAVLSFALHFVVIQEATISVDRIFDLYGLSLGVIGVLVTIFIGVVSISTTSRLISFQNKLTKQGQELAEYKTQLDDLSSIGARCTKESDETIMMNYTTMEKFYDQLSISLSDDLAAVISKAKKEIMRKRAVFGLESQVLEDLKRKQCAYDLLAVYSPQRDFDFICTIHQSEESSEIKEILGQIVNSANH
jgi:hypothetical protein